MNHPNLYFWTTLVTIVCSLQLGYSQQSEVSELEGKKTSEIGILPRSRKGVMIDASERNPYANRVVKQESSRDVKSEAFQIMKILEGLRVRGYSRDKNGDVRTVLYGDLRLTEGENVPQLLPHQNDKLYVSRVSNEEVELAWLTEAGNKVEDGRKILIAIKMEPLVQIVLPGQLVSDEASQKKRAWVDVNSTNGGGEQQPNLASKP